MRDERCERPDCRPGMSWTGPVSGFTLLEIMIALTIVGILAALAVPPYLNAARRAKFTEVVTATRVYRLGVEACFEATRDLLPCNAGSHGIPAEPPQGATVQVTVSSGIITATGVAGGVPDLLDKTYLLTPAPGPGGSLSWAVGGTAKEAGWIR